MRATELADARRGWSLRAACGALAVGLGLAVGCGAAWGRPLTPLDPPLPPTPKLSKADRAVIEDVTQRFGFDFLTIGAPGNRGATLAEAGMAGFTHGYKKSPNRGKVDYTYQLNRLPVSVEQYVQFVRVFKPYMQQIAAMPGAAENNSTNLSGSGIDAFFGSPGTIRIGWENTAADPSWRNAARFANWLHNGAPTTGLGWDTFHTGAYLFTDEHFTSQNSGTPITRTAEARFFLPTLDEIIKAAHYDPDKNGPGQEGYWKHHFTLDTTPMSGVHYPAGSFADVLRLGQFPDSQSPWGLLDTGLGSRLQWTETPTSHTPSGMTFFPGERAVISLPWQPFGAWIKLVEHSLPATFRIGVAVPGPSPCAVIIGVALLHGRRRR